MTSTCPRCGDSLSQTFHMGKVCFTCRRGHGCAVTLSAVRALCGRPDFANMLWRKAMDAPDGRGASCPQCGRPMSLIRLPVGETPLELDICCRCQLLWFDQNELEALPPKPPPPPTFEMPQKAKEILARHAIEELEGKTPAPAPTPWQYVAAFFGFPVEQGAPPLTTLPWCTWSLAALCVAAFVMTLPALPAYIQAMGLIPAESLRESGLTFLTAMFLHKDIMHLMGNLYFLLIFGDNVEDALGHAGYLALVLASGLSASLLHIALFRHSEVPCIGASGFISGIIAAYAVFFPQVTLSLLIRLRWTFIWRWLEIPAWGAFLIWFIFQTLMALLQTSVSGGGVAYGAHLGGALFGVTTGLFLRHRIRSRLSRLQQEEP